MPTRTGGNIWESSEVLARLLCARPADYWQDKRVVELGTGCGLVGLTALALGAAEVTLTDQVLFMARANLIANFGRDRLVDHGTPLFPFYAGFAPSPTYPRASADWQASAQEAAAAGDGGPSPLQVPGRAHLRQLYWGDAEAIAEAEPPFDLILGSDLMCDDG